MSSIIDTIRVLSLEGIHINIRSFDVIRAWGNVQQTHVTSLVNKMENEASLILVLSKFLSHILFFFSSNAYVID